MRYLSLFSGIGGLDLGLDRAGMECAGQVEIDPYCQKVLAKHWPDVKRMADIKEVKGDEFGTVDLICGGFPCQDVSVAGRREGLAGERSGLWFEFHRIIASSRPRWVVIENVPGLLSSNGGRDFAVIVRGLVECGYRVGWRVLDAQYFGVPQRRRRVFIVGHLGDGRAAEVLFEREGGGRDIAEGRSKGAGNPVRVGTLAANGGGVSRPAGQGNELDFCIPYVMAHGQANAEIVKDGSPSLTLNHEAPIVTNAHKAGDSAPHVMALQMNYIRRERIGDKVGTLAAQPGDAQFNGLWDKRHGVRRLTPVECERLQGFPDGWTESGWEHPSPAYIEECARKGEVPEAYVVKQMSDSTRYRQLGNAVAVPVAEWLGRRIMEVENENGHG